MRRLLSLSSSLLTLCLGSAAAAAPNSFVVDVPTDSRVSSTSPVTSARSILTRAASLSANVDLKLQRQRQIAGLQIFRFAQHHQGIPVFARGGAIAFDVNGVSRLASVKVEDRLPESVVPTLTRLQAAKLAATASGLDADANHTRLLIWPTEQGGRLAYSVLPPSLLPIPYAPVVIVDAHTGEVLTVHNLVRFKNLANVYEFNPTHTPNPIEVTLPIDDPYTAPQNDLLVSYNCVDTQTVKSVSYMGFNVNVHVCEMQQNATADGTTGDYAQYELEDHTSGGDPFAEVSIFYHTAKAYDYFKTFDPTFELESSSNPLFLISNLMLPAGLSSFDLDKMQDPNLPLEPFPNAMSVGWDPSMGQVISILWPEITGGMLMLGQGAQVDYSYDGDVVYHEFAHSVVGSTINLVGWWHLDEQGASASPGSMNEALADYFSSAITSDPSAGEYSAQEYNEPYIRNLENANTCPANVAGEVHYDSQFFSASLWAARSALPSSADKFAFDEAIFVALNTAASGDVGFEDLAEIMVSSVAASSLGQSAGDALESEFETRGVLPGCERTFVFEGTNIYSAAEELAKGFISAGKSMFAGGASMDFAPGTFQIEVPLPAGTTSIKASFVKLNMSGGTGGLPIGQGSEFDPAYIVSYDEPISFDWTAKTNNASDPADVAADGSRLAATFEVPDGAQTAYFMLVNRGDQDGYVSSFSFDFEGEVPADAGVDAAPPEEAGVDAEAPQDDAGVPSTPGASNDADEDDGGCGCRTTSSSTGGLGWVALLGMIGLGVARRRKTGTIRS